MTSGAHTEHNQGAEAEIDPTKLVALEAGDGTKLAHGPILKGQSKWTDGAYSLMVSIVPPGLITPVHKHSTDSQVGIVIRGRLAFWVEGSPEVELGPGGYVFRPAGKFHSLWNPTNEPAHLVEITSPGKDFEEYILETSRLTAVNGADRASIETAAARARITFTDDFLADLSARHGVSAEGAQGVYWK